MLLQDAQDLLSSLKDASAKVGLFLNANKTEYISINGNECPATILSRDGTQLKEVDDFKYLGSFVADNKKDSPGPSQWRLHLTVHEGSEYIMART